jgi:hypothetical protein
MPGHSRRRRRHFATPYVPGIHVFFVAASKTWMAGTSPGMTKERDNRTGKQNEHASYQN